MDLYRMMPGLYPQPVMDKVAIQTCQVKWMINRILPSTYTKSTPFKIGIYWDSENSVWVQLFPSSQEKEPPIARFSLRVTAGATGSRCAYSKEISNASNFSIVHNGLIRTNNDFAFRFDVEYADVEFDIVVEFSEIKISSSNGGEDILIWPIDERTTGRPAARYTSKSLSRMLNESLFTDITINLVDGKLHAHKAVLSANSPVLRSMFVHGLKEQQSSTIDIVDMTSDSCKALLRYMYGTINTDDISKHRWALLDAANKYNIPNLKDACEVSLLDDIGLENVLERLEEARHSGHDKLKMGCKAYLFDLGKICDLEENMMNDFIKRADRKLLEEISRELFLFKKGKRHC